MKNTSRIEKITSVRNLGTPSTNLPIQNSQGMVMACFYRTPNKIKDTLFQRLDINDSKKTVIKVIHENKKGDYYINTPEGKLYLDDEQKRQTDCLREILGVFWTFGVNDYEDLDEEMIYIECFKLLYENTFDKELKIKKIHETAYSIMYSNSKIENVMIQKHMLHNFNNIFPNGDYNIGFSIN